MPTYFRAVTTGEAGVVTSTCTRSPPTVAMTRVLPVAATEIGAPPSESRDTSTGAAGLVRSRPTSSPFSRSVYQSADPMSAPRGFAIAPSVIVWATVMSWIVRARMTMAASDGYSGSESQKATRYSPDATICRTMMLETSRSWALKSHIKSALSGREMSYTWIAS
jgi:hypothetical protein